MDAQTDTARGSHAPRPFRIKPLRPEPGTSHLGTGLQDLVSRVKEADPQTVNGLPFPEAGYKRHVLSLDPEAELIAATWAAGQGTPLHGHGSSQTLTKVLEGFIVEERFVPDGDDYRYELAELGPGSWSHAGPGVVHRVWGRTPTRTIQCTAPSNDNPLYPIDAALWPLLDEARAKAMRAE